VKFASKSVITACEWLTFSSRGLP